MTGRFGATRGAGRGLVIALAIGVGLAGTPVGAAENIPYDEKLAELAEVLGALHHLRPLCGATGETQTWREQMHAVLEAEQPSRERRLRLIDRFNQSYRSLAAVHRSCTPAARLLAEGCRKRGEVLGEELVSRWGHP